MRKLKRSDRPPARYRYDAANDSLLIELDEDAPAAPMEATEDPRVEVAVHDGKAVRIHVQHVQSWVLDLVADLVLERFADGKAKTRAPEPAALSIPPLLAESPVAALEPDPTADGAAAQPKAEHAAPPPAADGVRFEDLAVSEPLLSSLQAMGLSVPTPIQARAIPPALQGRDVIGLAQTGTGKTLAFVLPGLQRIAGGTHTPRMLVLTPTRELALQVSDTAVQAAAGSDLKVAAIFGGRPMAAQTKELKAGAAVAVATPGRLLDHLKRGNVRLDNIQVLVLDEADRMLDMGFLDEVRAILARLPSQRQTLLFGATLPPEIERLSREFQNDPIIVEVARSKPPETIDQVLLPVERHLKLPLLVHLLRNEKDLESMIIFTERKREADTVARQLSESGFEVALMHGDRKQSEREVALEGLRSGSVRILVATNLAARGLDIEDISHVVNYDMPGTVDEYVHRIGRTARAHAHGKAYSFVSLEDLGIVARIESALERALPRRIVEGFNYDVPTPSWARPSADAVQASLIRPKGRADVSRGLRRR
jgi:ATP-dependent RNA helicase RhlE